MENFTKTKPLLLIEKIMWLIIAVTAPGAAVLSFIGYMQYQPEAGGWNAAYHTMQLFILHAPHFEKPVPDFLQIGRWLAAIATILAVVKTAVDIASYIFRNRRLQKRLRKMKEHTILCGLGEIGFAVANNLPDPDNIVVIEKNTDNENLSILRKKGVKVFCENAMDPEVLEKVGISKAKCLYALTGDDFNNLSIINNLRRLNKTFGKVNKELKVSANIDSLNLKTAIRFEGTICENNCELKERIYKFYETAKSLQNPENVVDKTTLEKDLDLLKNKLIEYEPAESADYVEPKQQVRLFNINELCARYVFRKFPPNRFTPVTDANADPIRILFLGFSQTGEELFKLCLQNCHFINRKNTIITLIDLDIHKMEIKVQNKYPEIKNVVDLHFIEMNPHHLTNKFIKDYDETKHDEKGIRVILGKPDLIYICADLDKYQASYSIRAQEVYGKDVPIVRWFTKDVISHMDQASEVKMYTVDLMNTVATDEIINNSDVDQMAIATHHRWMKRDIANYIDKVDKQLKNNQEILKPKETLVPWHLLPEEIRDDNRSAVEHNLIKVRATGQFSTDEDFDNPNYNKVDLSFIKSIEQVVNENDIMWKLAEMEHRRWMATKYYYGWTIGKERNAEKKIRPDLIDFDFLDDGTKAYDFNQIREMSDVWLIWSEKKAPSTVPLENKQSWLNKIIDLIKSFWGTDPDKKTGSAVG
jgi:hypothetical protein